MDKTGTGFPGHITDEQRVELDFLIFQGGKCLILEVDNCQHTLDNARDRRMLKEVGIPTVRFTAQKYMNATASVMNEFLGMK